MQSTGFAVPLLFILTRWGASTLQQKDEPLSFLRSTPQFRALKEMVHKDPESLEVQLQSMCKTNPQLFQLIYIHQDSFARMLNEPSSSPANNPPQGSRGASTGGGVRFPLESSLGSSNQISPQDTEAIKD